jgi:TP901 family phage tail tape measure protein
MERVVEYLISLRAQANGVAQMAKQALEAAQAVKQLGAATVTTEKAMANLGKGDVGLRQVIKDAAAAQKEIWGVNNAAGKTKQQLRDMHWTAEQQRAMAQRVAGGAASVLGGGGAIVPPKGGLSERYLKGLHRGMGLHTLALMGQNNVLENFLEFDEKMRTVRGTLAGQASEEQLNSLRSAAMDISKRSIFSPAQVAEIFETQASSGIDIKDMARVAKQMIGLSTGTGENPAETFKTHLAIQRGFELPLTDFPHISDTIARIHQKTGISLGQISTQMGQIAAFAHTAGWTEEQTAGAVGYLAKRGMGVYAGSGLARLISKSQSWSKPAAEFWNSLGIKKEDVIDKSTGGMISPDGMMKLLQDHTQGMRPADVAQAFTKMFGDRGQKIAAAFAGGNPEELRTMIEDLKTVEGLAEKMGEEGMAGASAGVKRLGAAWKGFHTAIMESGIKDQIDYMANATANMLDRLSGSQGGTLNHPYLLQMAGWASLAGDALAAMAMPLLSISIIAPAAGAALNWLSGGTLAAGAVALRGALADIVTSALTLRGLTGIGLALFIGYEVVQHWDAVKAAIGGAAEMMQKLYDAAKKSAELWKETGSPFADTTKAEAARQEHMKATDNPGFKALMAAYFRTFDASDYLGDMAKGTVNRKAMSAYHMSRELAANPAPGVAAAAQAQAQRVQVESFVRLDPVVVQAPPSIQVNVTGQINGPVNGSGTIPLSTNAPRGQASSSPVAPPVSK